MGPCLCGDPYCHACGNPELAKLEALEEQLINDLAEHSLSAEEYQLFFDVGIAAVKAARLVTNKVLNDYKEDQKLDRQYECIYDGKEYNGEHTDD